ncbi:uncharacterized protein METZ01_LOCUS328022 [marine metagenome]|uniref:Uncharacterized protein n=1 Tax=marine metagenome TaxID=408172 RepID=A0A382PR92_9ZZZZ
MILFFIFSSYVLFVKVRPTGFEPVASCSGGKRSIQLSYGRIRKRISTRNGVITMAFLLFKL